MNKILNKINIFIQSHQDLKIIIDHCREYKSKNDLKIYIVGGIVRDILLERKINFDLDLVIEGDIDKFSKNLSKILNSKLQEVHGFPNFKLLLKEKFEIDIAHSRKEQYITSGSLPKWTKTSIYEDLYRRDFTINAIALEIKLNKLDIIDPLNGIKDINNKIIRILHQDSFKDDPTRIYRAIKYKSRLGFKFDNETKMNLYKSIKHIQNISTYRKNNELLKLLNEPNLNIILETIYLDKKLKNIIPNLFMNKIHFISKEFWGSSSQIEKLFFSIISFSDKAREEFLRSVNLSKINMKKISYYLEIKHLIETENNIKIEELKASKDFISTLYHCL